MFDCKEHQISVASFKRFIELLKSSFPRRGANMQVSMIAKKNIDHHP